MSKIHKYISSLARKKTLSDEDDGKPKLARCLTLLDLIFLGVGSTLGLGVYVLAGSVAKTQAGPAVIISFLVAAIASAFAGLCYAEFASRVPKAGSAYVYSYVSIGEFSAFIIGWNLILEYVIGASGVARGLSGYVDQLIHESMSKKLTELFPINVGFLSDYPDFLSFGLVLLVSALLAFGVKESTILNNIFTVLNLIVIVVVVVSGAIKANPDNWFIKKEDIPDDVNGGEGGFMPFGFSGVMAGAATCFFGFVGFDCVATTGEEAKNPKRNIPLSIVVSLIVIFISYFSISVVLTMMIPYYDQNEKAPFPNAFEKLDMNVIKMIVTIGAIFALCTSLLGAMFPLPRILYAMGKDGVIFRWMSIVHPYTKTPLYATIVSGVLSALMAMLFDLDQLIEMMSIGTLLAYTIVALSVLILRYEDQVAVKQVEPPVNNAKTAIDHSKYWFSQLFNLTMCKYPSPESTKITKIATTIYTLFCFGFGGMMAYGSSAVSDGEAWAIVLLAIFGAVLISCLIIIGRQPSSTLELTFKVPLVPLIPGLSILVNIYLMLVLKWETWIRFAVWMFVGFLIYFLYGHKNSTERAISKKASEIDSTKESIKN